MSVAAVTIAPGAWSDPRVQRLARLLGLPDPRFALIQLAHLWARCTYLGTDTPPLEEIEACLDENGPALLVRCGLGELLEDGVIRVRGGLDEEGKDRIGWFRRRHPEPAAPAVTTPLQKTRRVAGGLARRGAPREGGRFVKSTNHQHPPASDVAGANAGTSITSKIDVAGGSGSGSDSEEKVSPARGGNAGDAGDQQRPATSHAGGNAGASNIAGGGGRSRLIGDVWTYGQRKHAELRSSGIDPGSPLWSPMPTGTGATDLIARIRELAERGLPDPQIREACIHVIDVRAAEARAFQPPHLRYFIASRMFTAEAFTKGSELSPAQAAAAAAQGKPTRQAMRGVEPERPRRIENLKPA